MFLSHKIALDATFKQRRYFTQAAGTSRFTWNWGLAEWNRRHEAGEKPTGTSIKAAFNAVKYALFPWLAGVHRDAHSHPFANLQKAFVAFFKGAADRPTFKSKRHCRDSFYVANDKLKIEDLRVRLPVIGWVRLRERLRFAGKIMGAVVSREADRWFVSIQVDVGDHHRERTGDGVVGIDLGLTTFATISTGESVLAPKPMKRHLRRLRLAQRSLSRREKGSKNREKQRRKVARIYQRVSNIRSDFIHKFTTRFVRENQAVGVESLNVAGMLRNRKLARAISDVAWGETLRQFSYKGPIFGCEITAADQWEPSSKRCHRCGEVRETLSISERIFRCNGCGLVCDRDDNASQNLIPPAWRKFTPGDRGRTLAEPGTKTCSLVGAT